MCGDRATAPFEDICSRAIWAKFYVGRYTKARMNALGGRPSHCGKSLQSLITIMTVEPTATTTGQINGNSSSRPTSDARNRRVLFTRAKRQPATPIGHLHLAPAAAV
jgi:hypothetical protein